MVDLLLFLVTVKVNSLVSSICMVKFSPEFGSKEYFQSCYEEVDELTVS